MFISRLFDENGAPHPLCHVATLQKYLEYTSNIKSFKIFVDPVSIKDLSLHKLRLYLCKFIRKANPSSFPKSHDLRKLATYFGFFHDMSSEQL